jgi:hypothetical protein
MLQMALQRLKQLAAHEVGHTDSCIIIFQAHKIECHGLSPPMVTLNSNNEIDLSSAYTNEIGDWDKVSIQYGYEHFQRKQMKLPPLIKLSDASKGTHFISDRCP